MRNSSIGLVDDRGVNGVVDVDARDRKHRLIDPAALFRSEDGRMALQCSRGRIHGHLDPYEQTPSSQRRHSKGVIS